MQKLKCWLSAFVCLYLIYTLIIGYPQIPKYRQQRDLTETQWNDIMTNLNGYQTKLRSFYIVLLITIGLAANTYYIASNKDTQLDEMEFDFDTSS